MSDNDRNSGTTINEAPAEGSYDGPERRKKERRLTPKMVENMEWMKKRPEIKAQIAELQAQNAELNQRLAELNEQYRLELARIERENAVERDVLEQQHKQQIEKSQRLVEELNQRITVLEAVVAEKDQALAEAARKATEDATSYDGLFEEWCQATVEVKNATETVERLRQELSDVGGTHMKEVGKLFADHQEHVRVLEAEHERNVANINELHAIQLEKECGALKDEKEGALNAAEGRLTAANITIATQGHELHQKELQLAHALQREDQFRRELAALESRWVGPALETALGKLADRARTVVSAVANFFTVRRRQFAVGAGVVMAAFLTIALIRVRIETGSSPAQAEATITKPTSVSPTNSPAVVPDPAAPQPVAVPAPAPATTVSLFVSAEASEGTMEDKTVAPVADPMAELIALLPSVKSKVYGTPKTCAAMADRHHQRGVKCVSSGPEIEKLWAFYAGLNQHLGQKVFAESKTDDYGNQMYANLFRLQGFMGLKKNGGFGPQTDQEIRKPDFLGRLQTALAQITTSATITAASK